MQPKVKCLPCGKLIAAEAFNYTFQSAFFTFNANDSIIQPHAVVTFSSAFFTLLHFISHEFLIKKFNLNFSRECVHSMKINLFMYK